MMCPVYRNENKYRVHNETYRGALQLSIRSNKSKSLDFFSYSHLFYEHPSPSFFFKKDMISPL